MKCKKSIMGLAALLILIFHFYIPFTKNAVEMTIYKAGYIGVDLFFFVSACSLGKQKKVAYGSFLWNRINNTYVPFVILAVIGAVYKHWSPVQWLKVISGVEFFQRGGGAFLWFCIGIMLVYLLAPALVACKTRLGWKAFPIFMAGWLVIALLLQYVFAYKPLFILVNRLPIFFIGMYYEEIRNIKWGAMRWPLILIGLGAGAYLVALWGATVRLNVPLTDMYYIIAIVFTVALVALFDALSRVVPFGNKPLQWLGGITLELYGLQMIFGYDLEAWFIKQWKNGQAAFAATVVVLIAMAWVFHFGRTLITKGFQKMKENKRHEK